MARPPRYFYPGVASHVMVRGNDRQDMFATDGDRLMFRRLLLEASVAHKVAVHGYAFMPNHVHLLVTGAFAGDVSRMAAGRTLLVTSPAGSQLVRNSLASGA